jgi:hypothetical protein
LRAGGSLWLSPALLWSLVMESDELTAALENCSLAPSDFSHARHLQLAWYYLCTLPPDQAEQRFVANLRRYVAHVGAEGKFHLTMTVALVRLIAACGPRLDQNWEDFRTQHPELLSHWRRLLDRHYSSEQLERGRLVLVEPDREPLPR